MGHNDTCDWITGEDGGTCTCGWNNKCDKDMVALKCAIEHNRESDVDNAE